MVPPATTVAVPSSFAMLRLVAGATVLVTVLILLLRLESKIAAGTLATATLVAVPAKPLLKVAVTR